MATWHGLEVGDEVELDIREKSRDGRGIGRIKGLIIFVAGAAVGEKVRIRITRVAARHAEGTIVQKLAN